jgi:hypothetical protein
MKSKFNALKVVAPLFVLLVLFFQGCQEDGATTVVSTNLSDPNVQPAVIFTNPPNGGQGPFNNVYNGYDGYGSYHFFVQFNKLMDGNTINYSNISIEGFSEPVTVQSSNYGSQYSDMYRFSIISTKNYNYAKFEVGHTYTVRIRSKVQDIHGYNLKSDYVFTFSPEPAFRAVSGYPVDVVQDGTITPSIQFNSKVTSAIGASIKFTPNISGTWLVSSYDSTRITFTPNTDFTLETTYTVEVQSGAADRENNSIAKPYSFSFLKKNNFKVDYIYTTTLDQRLAYRIAFNGMVDTNTVRNAFSTTPTVKGRIDFNYSNYDFYFIPDSGLVPGAQFTIALSSAVKSKSGIPLQAFSAQLYAADFQSNSFYPYQYSDVSRYSSVEIRMTYDVDTSTVKGAFSITPAVEGTLFSYKNFIHFVPSKILDANTLYTVTVTTTLKTTGGYPLKYSFSNNFRTGK